MYDLIGDIHGYATPLKKLLEKLGYTKVGNHWSHPERKVIFLGDFIDRGPEQIEVYQIARNMTDAGDALSIIGNHEFNAVAYATETTLGSGQYLRKHSDKNKQQHREFLQQVGENSVLHLEMINWFKTLPLYLDLPDFRVVHACWDPRSLDTIKPFLNKHKALLPSAWSVVCCEGNEAFEAVEVLLKGLEIHLPQGNAFKDKDSVPRTNIRTKWWHGSALTYRDLAMVSADVIGQIPHTPIEADVLPGYDGLKPVFVGHYWLSGTPKPLTEHIACLDYSIAAAGSKDRKLVAYRWHGKKQLSSEQFVSVSIDD